MNASNPGTTNGGAPRVVVVDADRRVQQSLAEVLRVAGLEVVGATGDVRSALEMMAELQPAVLIVDPRLPDLEAGAALLSSVDLGWPAVRIVVMGWPDGGAGELSQADAFVSKSAQPDEFVAAAVAACDC